MTDDIKTQNFRVGKQALLCKIRPYHVKSLDLWEKKHTREMLEKDPFSCEIQNDYTYSTCQTMTLPARFSTSTTLLFPFHIAPLGSTIAACFVGRPFLVTQPLCPDSLHRISRQQANLIMLTDPAKKSCSIWSIKIYKFIDYCCPWSGVFMF